MTRTTRKRIARTDVATWGLLGATAAVALVLPQDLVIQLGAAASPPTEIEIGGIVRDFRMAHDDFEVVPPGGFGHIAGNVALATGADDLPEFVPAASGTGGPSTNVVAHWTLDDAAGTTAINAVAGQDGTLVNGPTWVSGVSGTALHFDGANDYVNVPSNPAIRITGDMTIAGWFKLDQDFDASSSTSQIILERYQDNEHNTMLALIGNDCLRPDLPRGSLCLKVENGTTVFEFRYKWTNRRSWTAGTWYHFACTIVSADSSQNAIYVDGVDDTDGADLGSTGYIDTDYPADLRIGGRNGDAYVIPEAYFDGVIDEIKMYDSALTPADFSEGGYRVTAQWRNGASQPIAPHLVGLPPSAGNELALVNAPTFANSASTDSFDSSIGPYGGANVGPAPAYVTGSTMPTVSIPSPGNFTTTYTQTGGSHTISTSFECDDFILDTTTTVTVDGHVAIVANELFRVANQSRILLAPDSSLTVFARKDFVLENQAQVNMNTADPSACTIHLTASGVDATISNTSDIYAHVIAPNTRLYLHNSGQVYGRYVGRDLHLQNSSMFHVDDFGSSGVCGTPIADAAGTAGGPNDAAITSGATFDEWFRDVDGANLSKMHSITLVNDGSGVFEYIEPAFHPIDDALFGNEGLAHNWHLTYSIVADFTYARCTGQFLELGGDDAFYAFIDGQLVIDLGGVRPGTTQVVELDRLGLVDGQAYAARIFYAQRHSGAAGFSMRTNLELSTQAYIPAISMVYD